MPSEAGGHEDSGDTALKSPRGLLGGKRSSLFPVSAGILAQNEQNIGLGWERHPGSGWGS